MFITTTDRSPADRRPWVVLSPADQSFVQACRPYPQLIAEVLWQRGLRTSIEVQEFVNPEFSRSTHDPFLYSHMRLAVDHILAAVRDRQQITVYGDYDADGICGTAILVEAISALGGSVDWYLPERLSEGYGLNIPAIERLHARGTKLLIAVDCGSTNVAEIVRAKELGLAVLVFDHHQEPINRPPADGIINPMFADAGYPFQYQASAGVALTVVRALLQATKSGAVTGHPLPDDWLDRVVELAAIATVTDMMPLRGENRAVVKHGLAILRQTGRPGLRALLDVIGHTRNQVSEYVIGWQIGPRLNAAGRLRHPSLALELLLTKEPATARDLAARLQALNVDRQRLTEMAVAEAGEQISQQGEQDAYAAFASHWSPGILGLVAGRLAEQMARPVLVMTENEGQVIGSGRSVPGFDIMVVMNAGAEHFRRFGGHAAACGFTLVASNRRAEFQTWWQSAVSSRRPTESAGQPLFIDAAADLTDVNAEVLDLLDGLSPYGIEHPRPKFRLASVKLQQVATVGASRQHLRLTGEQSGQRQSFIGFRMARLATTLAAGQTIDIVGEPSWNIWQGKKERQFKIIDLRKSQ